MRRSEKLGPFCRRTEIGRADQSAVVGALASVAQWLGASATCKQKGREFDSQSGHIPRLWVGAYLRGQLIDVSLSSMSPPPFIPF